MSCIALGACARNPSPVTRSEGAAALDRLASVRFDNEGREQVHVYLVSETREWLLGRVEPGARATFRLPTASLTETAGLLRLAVLAGTPTSVLGARDPRAAFTIPQPASSILSQRWTFAQRPFAPAEVFGARATARRR